MKSPLCPRCDSGELTLLHSRQGSGYVHPETGEFIEQTICIFKCGCGCEFPHAFRKAVAHGATFASATEALPLVAGGRR